LLSKEAGVNHSNIRIGAKDHEELKALSKDSKRSMTDLMHTAILDLKRKFILKKTNAAYRELRKNKTAWAKETAERSSFEKATLADIKTPRSKR
jgi:hypothetical protein